MDKLVPPWIFLSLVEHNTQEFGAGWGGGAANHLPKRGEPAHHIPNIFH